MATRRQDLIQTYIHVCLIFCRSFTELISSLSSLFRGLFDGAVNFAASTYFPIKQHRDELNKWFEETASTSVEEQTHDYRLTECSVTALINFLLYKSLNLLFELQRIR
jgi:hypothetical protein